MADVHPHWPSLQAVEQSPADLKVTDARSMMQLWDRVYRK
jgi:hypothetical protein